MRYTVLLSGVFASRIRRESGRLEIPITNYGDAPLQSPISWEYFDGSGYVPVVCESGGSDAYIPGGDTRAFFCVNSDIPDKGNGRASFDGEATEFSFGKESSGLLT